MPHLTVRWIEHPSFQIWPSKSILWIIYGKKHVYAANVKLTNCLLFRTADFEAWDARNCLVFRADIWMNLARDAMDAHCTICNWLTIWLQINSQFLLSLIPNHWSQHLLSNQIHPAARFQNELYSDRQIQGKSQRQTQIQRNYLINIGQIISELDSYRSCTKIAPHENFKATFKRNLRNKFSKSCWKQCLLFRVGWFQEMHQDGSPWSPTRSNLTSWLSNVKDEDLDVWLIEEEKNIFLFLIFNLQNKRLQSTVAFVVKLVLWEVSSGHFLRGCTIHQRLHHTRRLQITQFYATYNHNHNCTIVCTIHQRLHHRWFCRLHNFTQLTINCLWLYNSTSRYVDLNHKY